MKKFGEKLRQLRKARKLSQRALAKGIGVAVATVQLYEQKNSIPGADVVARVARFFQVSADYLVFDDQDALEKVQDRDLKDYFTKVDQLHHRHKFLVKEFIDSLVAR